MVHEVARILNERLAGLTLLRIRARLAERLRMPADASQGRELLNIFIAEGEEIFDLFDEDAVVLGSAQMLAEQPEFASNARMRDCFDSPRARRAEAGARSRRSGGLSITIGSENPTPAHRVHPGHLVLSRRAT